MWTAPGRKEVVSDRLGSEGVGEEVRGWEVQGRDGKRK